MINHYTQAHFDRSALINIDTQNDFTLDGAPGFIAGTLEVIPNMQRLLRLYRKKGLLIIHVVRLYLDDGSNVDLCRRASIENGHHMITPGSDGAELVSEIRPSENSRLDAQKLLGGEFQAIGDQEYVMYKPRWGAFYQTRLEEFLRVHDIDTLVFCGCNYPNCPRTSMYQASERDFRAVLVRDAVSQLYARGEKELSNIGIGLLDTQELEKILA